MHITSVALGTNARAATGEFAISLATPEHPYRQLLIRENGQVEIPADMTREEALLVAGAVLYRYPREASEVDGPGIFTRLLDLLIR